MGRSPSPARRRKDKHRDRIKHRKRSRSREKSRSRSPVDRRRKERRYSRSPVERSRRTRSRSYERDRKRSPPPSSSHKLSKTSTRATSSKNDFEGSLTVDEQEMSKLMGFSGFSSTKGKKVEGNDVGEVHVILKRKYRQYMNRKGGFNRPLDFIA